MNAQTDIITDMFNAQRAAFAPRFSVPKFVAAALNCIGTPYQVRGRVPMTERMHDSALDFLGVIAYAYKQATGRAFPLEHAPDYGANGYFLGEGGWLDALLMHAGFERVDGRPEIGDVVIYDARPNRGNHFYGAGIVTPCQYTGTFITHAYFGRSCTESPYEPFWSKHTVGVYRYAKAQSLQAAE